MGGAVAGAFLLLDASLFWVLALPSTAGHAFPGLLWIFATSAVLVRRARPLSPTAAVKPT